MKSFWDRAFEVVRYFALGVAVTLGILSLFRSPGSIDSVAYAAFAYALVNDIRIDRVAGRL